MITEDYVSFETAKLLKEKGFDGGCTTITDDVYDIARTTWPQTYVKDGKFLEREGMYLLPTLQMAMKWLREVHHLFIGCGPRLSFTDFYWITANIYRVRKKSSLYHTEDVDDYHCVASCDSHSYEEACETAIKYCLENLI